MKCPRCEYENRRDRRFWGECGVPLALACVACGFSNDPGEKFCGGYGQPLGNAPPVTKFAEPAAYTPKHLAEKILTSKAALEGERKQVTVLFADLKAPWNCSPSAIPKRPARSSTPYGLDGLKLARASQRGILG
ncbi:MAG: zinc ribbon domain-containing protein [Candidatus Rokuibacteriota bacterium]|nr:MAG: zinc ribbon domain-containing protein [Candidatus Rokubacteria bacterium]